LSDTINSLWADQHKLRNLKWKSTNKIEVEIHAE